jgi:two-component sensor histidine kinase
MIYDIYSIRKLLIRNSVNSASILAMTSSSSLAFQDPKFATKLLTGFRKEPRVVAACLYNNDGTIFSRYVRELVDYKFPTKYPAEGYYFEGKYLDVIMPIIFEGDPVGMVFIRSHTQELYARIKRYALISVIVLVFSASISLFISKAFQYIITQPVFELVKTSNLVSKNKDYSLRSIKHADDELGVLTDAFNEMLEQIELKDSQLQRYSDQLEERVYERTKELVKANEQLTNEINQRMKAEEKIKDSLSEKEVLLSEIHHRVKNNFQIVSSLFEMSSMRAENSQAQEVLKNARVRIYTMALIHDQLYQNKRFDRISMEKHIKELTTYLHTLYGNAGGKIRTKIEASEVYLSMGQAVPCALVLNELVANAFKHGFIKKRTGNIWISIDNIDEDTTFLLVKDDGDGFPEGFELNKATGIGLKLVKRLVRDQLKGKMSINHDDGMEFRVQFKRI